MKKEIRLKLAKRLRQLRGRHNLTQQKLSFLAGIDYKHLQRLESRDPPNARIDTLEKIAKAFNISLLKLIDFKNSGVLPGYPLKPQIEGRDEAISPEE